MTNRIQSGSYIRIQVPLEQFQTTGDSIQYTQSGSSTANAMTTVSTNSSHIILEFQEFCSSGSAFCSDGTSMTITITQGFKNARTVLTSFSNFFKFQSYTPDQQYQIDESTTQISPTPSLTKATISSISVAFQSSVTAYEGYVDISAVLGSTVLASDYVELTFSTEFIRQGTGSVTCGRVSSGTETTITCTPTFTSNYLSKIIVNGLCA